MPKLRLNAPAVRAFFPSEKFKGARVKLTDDGRISLKPVTRLNHPDVIPVVERQRGGLSLYVDPEGAQTEALMKRFRNPYRNPFFMLSWASGDWIEAVPFNGVNTLGNQSRVPSRFRPHLRVYSENYYEDHEMYMELPDFVNEIREAQRIVQEYDAKRITGRPPRHVTDARRKLVIFADLARELIYLEPLKQIQSLASGFLGDPSASLLHRLSMRDDPPPINPPSDPSGDPVDEETVAPNDFDSSIGHNSDNHRHHESVTV